MLTAHKFLASFLFFAQLTGAMAANIQNINDRTVKQLRKDFSKATSPSLKSLDTGASWDCRLYGMRSRLQVKNKTNFYQFQLAANGSLRNDGLQIVRTYEPNSEQIEGAFGAISDAVRLTKDHRLIAELSVTKAKYQNVVDRQKDISAISNPQKIVIAYTVCDTKVAAVR